MKLARKIAGNDRVAVDLTKQAINRSLEIMGMRSALEQALETAVVIGAQETPESRAFNEVLERDGPKAAIAWRRERLRAETEPAP
jgi:enoyl-CoA hydratase